MDNENDLNDLVGEEPSSVGDSERGAMKSAASHEADPLGPDRHLQALFDLQGLGAHLWEGVTRTIMFGS